MLKNNKLPFSNGLILLIPILIITAIFSFKSSVNSFTYNITNDNLQKITENNVNALKSKLESNLFILQILIQYIDTVDELSDPKLLKIIDKTIQNSDFHRISITDTNGNMYTHDGVSSNISLGQYYNLALKGNIVISEPIISTIDGKKIMLLTLPIIKDNQIIGTIVGSYELSLLNNLLYTYIYNGNSYIFITNKEGKIIISSENMVDHIGHYLSDESSFDHYDTITNTIFDLPNFNEDNLYNIYQKGNYCVTYSPLKINDWYIFTVVPKSEVQQVSSHISRITYIFTTIISIALIILILLIYIRDKNRIHQIRATKEHLENLIKNINGGVIIRTISKNNDNINIDYLSDGFFSIIDLQKTEIDKMLSDNKLSYISEDDRLMVLNTFKKPMSDIFTLEYKIDYNNEIIYVLENVRLTVETETYRTFQSIITNISEIKKQQELLYLSEERYKYIIRETNSAIFEFDYNTNKIIHIENIDKVLGYKVSGDDAITFINNQILLHPEDDYLIRKIKYSVKKGKHSTSMKIRIMNSQNQYVWCDLHITVLNNLEFKPARLFGSITNINNQIMEQIDLKEKAERDLLTGLYNKITVENEINDYLSNNPTKKGMFVLLDIDNFKAINDNFGHIYGDKVIQDVSTIIIEIFNNNSIIGRIGGDEFILFVKDIEHFNSTIKELSERLVITYTENNKSVTISSSIGITKCNNKYDHYQELYRRADMAAYASKTDGKARCTMYSTSLEN